MHTAPQEMRRGRTSGVISHRLGTIRDANVIALLARHFGFVTPERLLGKVLRRI